IECDDLVADGAPVGGGDGVVLTFGIDHEHGTRVVEQRGDDATHAFAGAGWGERKEVCVARVAEEWPFPAAAASDDKSVRRLEAPGRSPSGAALGGGVW